MTVDDFWMRLYSLSDELQPVSESAWNEKSKCLIDEFRKFPHTTRETLRGHVSVMIERLQQLYARLA